MTAIAIKTYSAAIIDHDNYGWYYSLATIAAFSIWAVYHGNIIMDCEVE
jgi:hypothetical protein